MVRAIEPFRPFLVEELLHPEDYDGYRQVSEAVDTRIACGEQEATEWGFEQLIERGGVDVLQPDLTRCGGFTVARKIVHMAERANRLVIPHSWSSDLLTAASLHLTAFQRRAEFVEFSTSQGPLSRLLVKEPLRMKDGYLPVPRGPGLGVEVNDAVIEQIPSCVRSEPERVGYRALRVCGTESVHGRRVGCMDQLGVRNQAMREYLRPVHGRKHVLPVGRAQFPARICTTSGRSVRDSRSKRSTACCRVK